MPLALLGLQLAGNRLWDLFGLHCPVTQFLITGFDAESGSRGTEYKDEFSKLVLEFLELAL